MPSPALHLDATGPWLISLHTIGQHHRRSRCNNVTLQQWSKGASPCRSACQLKYTAGAEICTFAGIKALAEPSAASEGLCTLVLSCPADTGNSQTDEPACPANLSEPPEGEQHLQWQAVLVSAAISLAPLKELRAPQLQWKQRKEYVRGPRRWLGFRGGRMIEVVHPAPWYTPEGAWKGAQTVAPLHVWTFVLGILFSALLHRLAYWYKERRRAHQATRAAALQTAEASKRSLFEQRSRFQRALGALEVDEPASALEEDSIEEADTSISTGYDGEEEEEVDRRWQVDKDAMREWEVFIKKSKSAQARPAPCSVGSTMHT
ncbi:g10929 [Coccomyxa elongata]